MKTMNATDAKNRFGEMLDNVQAGPVAIQKNGRDVAVVLSKAEFDRQFGEQEANPRVLQLHENLMQRYDASFKKLAE